MYKVDPDKVSHGASKTLARKFQMKTCVLGIDISKQKFDVTLCLNGKNKHRDFSNNLAGFHALDKWLEKNGAHDPHACMEATGIYGDKLANYLVDTKRRVSVVNPAQIKGFSQSQLTRTKTDKADSKLIAGFCLAVKPALWQPKPQHIRELQAWAKRIDSLERMKRQELNRRETSDCDQLTAEIDRHVEALDERIAFAESEIEKIIADHPDLKEKKKLLETIPGVGHGTATRVLAFIGEPSDFTRAKQVSTYLGLNPRQHHSGTSVHHRTRISKVGDSQLRRIFYMPAMAAMRFNPTIKNFSAVLKQRGKAGKAIVVAAMRKLVHLIYGVLKSGKPFDPNWAKKNLLLADQTA